MASITSWMRLEPRSRRDTIDAGLQARVHDPLWLLGRQWQFNEFKAEDAGSPVAVQIVGDADQVTRYLAGNLPPDGRAIGALLDEKAAPLEAIVQREPYTRAAHVDLRFTADAGRWFVRELETFGVAKYAPRYLELYALAAPALSDAPDKAFAAALAGRVIDGARLYRALRGPHPALPAIKVEDQPLVDSATQAWLAWYDLIVSDPTDDTSAWQPSRMEYSFAIAAGTSDGERVLEAPDHGGGPVEWHDFRIRPGASLGTTPAEASRKPLTRTVIPAPVRYPGMPADRWWEFEDARVDFGAVTTLPGDAASLVLLHFAITYGSDWFIVPAPVPVGGLCTIGSVTATDCFGETFDVPSFSGAGGAADGWRMFSLSGEGEHLFVPPSLAALAAPRTVETVLLARDEAANMAWAIERQVLNEAGRVTDRTQIAKQPSDVGPASLSYSLVTAVPENWIPLIPVRDANHRVHLRRASMAVTGAPPPNARGAIIGEERALIIADEEIPRSGATLTRSFCHARWTDGSSHLWMGRRKQAGQGEANSGLEFDSARKTREAPQ